MLARNYKEGVHPPALDNVGGFQQGQVAIYDSASSAGESQVKLPTGTAPWLQIPYGINDSAGFVGGSGTTLGEALALTRQGLCRMKLTNGITTTRGAELIADASVLGNVKLRTPYSFSAYVLGTAEEAYSSSATDDLIEAYMQPALKEVIRSVFAATSSTFGADTKYIAPGYVALAAAQVPVFVAAFTGQVVRNLVTSLATAPAGTDTVVYTIQKSSDNGATWTDTAVTCTTTGTAKASSDLTHSAVLAAGDLLAIKAVSSATTAAIAAVQFDVT